MRLSILFIFCTHLSLLLCNSLEVTYIDNSIKIIENNISISKGNSYIKIGKHTFDYYKLEFICEQSNLTYKINEIEWEKTNYNVSNIKLKNNFDITESSIQKNCPTVYFEVFPYKVDENNNLLYMKSMSLTFNIKDVFLDNFCLPDKEVINKDYVHSKFYLKQTRDIDYIILTNNTFINVAEIFKNIHNDLNIEIIDVNDIYNIFENDEIEYEYAIRNYLINRINNEFSLKYLLIFGDETIVPPIYNGTIPSDDFYTSPGILSANPQLSTGRIPVNNVLDAEDYVNKLESYSLKLLDNNDLDQSWRMTISLLSDDENNPNPNKYPEISHTQNSDIIYNQMKDNLIMKPFYGVNYTPNQNSDGLIHNDLTADIISNINNGISLINYIGHGNYNTLADEKIIDLERDLNLINTSDFKLPIWVVGTCSFGEYDGKDSMSEALLFKENGAISVISTTRGIGETSNINYLTKFFNRLNNFIDDDTNNSRLGDLVRDSKNNSGSEYLFHLFGDPAQQLPFPKKSNNLFDNFPEELIIGQQTLVDTDNLEGFIEVFDSEKEIIKTFSNGDSINYNMPGDIVHRGTFENHICFTTSIDASTCNDCASIYAFTKNNEFNLIQKENYIDINNNDDLLYDDLNGPIINFLSDDYIYLNDNDIIYLNNQIIVQVEDKSGINLMGGLGHDIRYWFNNEQNYQIIDSENFIYTSNCEDNPSGQFKIDVLDLNDGKNTLFIEVWDNLNNKSLSQINLNIKSFTFESYDVYNFPNPFKEDTYFTFKTSIYPTIAKIKIFNLNGDHIQTLNQNCESSFCSIYWNGKNKENNFINNGTYIYNLSLKHNNMKYSNLYKLTKLK